MANLKGKMKKLQTALVKSGVLVKINQYQFYSEDQKRMITQYRVVETNQNTRKDTEKLKTCSMVEVIKYLLERYRQVSE